MEYQYIKIEFDYGHQGQGYQEIDIDHVIRITDLDGNTLDLQPPYGYFIIDKNPPKPTWAT